MSAPSPKAFYSPQAAAVEIGISKRTLYRRLAQCGMRPIVLRNNNCTMLTVEQVELIRRHEAKRPR